MPYAKVHSIFSCSQNLFSLSPHQHCRKRRFLTENIMYFCFIRAVSVYFSSFPIWNSWLEIKSKEYQETESGLHRRITKLLRLRWKLPIDEVAEWLRRWTANPMCSACVGSNPILVDPFLVCCLSTLVRSLVSWCLIFLLIPSSECSINNLVNK